MRNSGFSVLLSGFLAIVSAAAPAGAFEGDEERHTAIERISAEDARSKVQAGKAFLVCAYNDKRCEGLLLEGALTRREFEQELPSMSKEKEIIIYCS